MGLVLQASGKLPAGFSCCYKKALQGKEVLLHEAFRNHKQKGSPRRNKQKGANPFFSLLLPLEPHITRTQHIASRQSRNVVCKVPASWSRVGKGRLGDERQELNSWRCRRGLCLIISTWQRSCTRTESNNCLWGGDLGVVRFKTDF